MTQVSIASVHHMVVSVHHMVIMVSCFIVWAYIQEVLDNGRNRFCDPAFYRTPITCVSCVCNSVGSIDSLQPKPCLLLCRFTHMEQKITSF